MISAERLRELLVYEPDTGYFRWVVSRGCMASGAIAGTLQHHGYRQIKLDGVLHTASRLAWLYMTGEHPPVLVDHRDGDTTNDRWSNLRLATRSQNGANRKIHVNNRSGLKGVHWSKSNRRWLATIQVNGERRVIGQFQTKEAAHQAYVATATKAFGEFARV